MRIVDRTLLLVLPALALYALFALSVNMLQDDAFISYRYAANFLNGDGLVFNVGEYIEGITNHGWTILLIAFGVLKLNYVLLSQLIGALFGGGIVIVTYLTARLLLPEDRKYFSLIPTYLVGANLSLAYWAPAGLETAAFAFFSALSVYFCLKRSWLLVWALAMAVWLRPEGALVVGLLIFTDLTVYRRFPSFLLACAAISFGISVPFVMFKYFYYGSIIPNPFYAKTGFDANQLHNGVEYTWQFLEHYGFWGAGLAVSLAFLPRLPRPARFVWVYTVCYMAYVLLVGGDVLKVHRFYMPIVGAFAMVSMMALWGATIGSWRRIVSWVVAAIAVTMLAISIAVPRSYVKGFNFLEKALVQKMQFMADQMSRNDDRQFSVALSTIGAFGYRLVGHRIIDMLGLTDSTIAHHTEAPIEGMKSTWKEQSHNSAYLLTSEPDYILFSTGIKPSAPAELALFLYPEFLKSYYMIGFYYKPEQAATGTTQSVFRRRSEIAGTPVPKFPVEYVQAFKTGIEHYAAMDFQGAIPYLEQAVALSPLECHALPLYRLGVCLLGIQEHERAERVMDSALAIDSFLYEAHRDLMIYALARHDPIKANIHYRWLMRLVPWYWPAIERKLDREVQGPWRQFLGLPGLGKKD